MNVSVCPDRDRLRRYSIGQLPASGLESVADHLLHCAQCEGVVESLEGDTDWIVQELRSAVGGTGMLPVPFVSSVSTGETPVPPTSDSSDPLEAEPELGHALAAIRSSFSKPGFKEVRQPKWQDPDELSPRSAASGSSQGSDLASRSSVEREGQGGESRRSSELGSIREYDLLERIGQGGMGTVYKAVHRKLNRVVAIKMLPDSRVHHEAAVRRFAREMEVVAKLAHPNIVKALDAGEENGRHFLVFEFVDGTNLHELIKSNGSLPVRETARIGYEVARALAHANDHGIIHRDVKPSNILLSTTGQVMLADLGLAKFFGNRATPEGVRAASPTVDTRSGELLGSIDYLAPEQARDASQADLRSDIYALGCTLYHCLTGRVPFTVGPDVQRIMAHIEREPEPIVDLNPQVPVALAELIHSCMLAKRPEDRFQTPREVAVALAPWAGVGLGVGDRGLGVGKASTNWDSSYSPTRQPAHSAVASEESTRSKAATSTETRTDVSELDQAPPVEGRRWKALRWRRIVAALVGLGLLVAGGFYVSGILLKVRSPDGTVVLQFDQPEIAGASVFVDDKHTITLSTPGDPDPIELRIAKGRRRLKVTKAGFETFTEAFTIQSNGRKTIRVRLEPLTDLSRPETKVAVVPGRPLSNLYGGVALRSPYSSLNPGTIVTLDVASGAARAVGFPAVAGETSFGVTGLAFNSKGELFASVYAREGLRGAVSVVPTLIQIDPDTGHLVQVIGDIRDKNGLSLKICDLAMQPGTDVLYGIGGGAIRSVRNPGGAGNAHLFTIDPRTAVATWLGDTGRSFGGAIAFVPDGTLYHATFLGPLSPAAQREPALTILDPATARLTASVPLRDPTSRPHLLVPRGLAVRPDDGVIFLATNYAHQDAVPLEELHNNLLATIDPETGMVTPLAASVEDVRNRVGDLAFRPPEAKPQSGSAEEP